MPCGKNLHNLHECWLENNKSVHNVSPSRCCLDIIDRAQVDVHNNLGDLWRAQGTSGRVAAQRCYAEALRRNPQHAPAWRGLGDLYREFGDHPQAVACYQVSI